MLEVPLLPHNHHVPKWRTVTIISQVIFILRRVPPPRKVDQPLPVQMHERNYSLVNGLIMLDKGSLSFWQELNRHDQRYKGPGKIGGRVTMSILKFFMSDNVSFDSQKLISWKNLLVFECSTSLEFVLLLQANSANHLKCLF